MTLVTVVMQLFDSRIWETVIRYVPHYQERGQDSRAVATVQLSYLLETASGLVSFAVLLGVAEIGSRLFIKDPQAAELVRTFALFALLRIPFEATSALLRVGDRFDWIAYQRAAGSGVATAGTLWVWWWGPTVERMLWVQLGATAVAIAILLGMGVRVARAMGLGLWSRWELGALRGQYREVLRFTLLSNATGSARLVSTHADLLVLGYFGTPAVVGVYELARRIVSAVHRFSDPLYVAVFPEISRAVARSAFGQVRELRRRLTRTVLGAILPICIAATLAAPLLIPLVFGAEFDASVRLFQILIWQLLWLPLLWVSPLLLSVGRAGLVAALAWAASLLYLALLLALVPGAQATGAAVATLCYHLSWLLLAGGALRVVKELRPEPDAAGDATREA